MESSLKENFGDVKAKNSTEEAPRRRSNACGPVKYRRGRSRYKRSEAEAIRRPNQEKLVHHGAVQQKPQFSGLNLSRKCTVPNEVEAAGFQGCPDELGSVVEGHDIKKFTIHGGAKGSAAKLSTSISKRTSSFDQLLNKRKEIYGFNKFTESPARGFWLIVGEAFLYMTLITLAFCALDSLVVGVIVEGRPQGAHDGLGIVGLILWLLAYTGEALLHMTLTESPVRGFWLIVCILLVVFVTATSDYKQSLHFKDLDKGKQKIVVQVTRNGFMQKISIDDLLPGDTVTVAAMEREEPVDFTYKVRSFRDMNDDPSAVRDCNSQRSGEFPTASSEGRRLLMTSVSENSDDLIRQLVADLGSCSIDEQKKAARKIRLLAKNDSENRIKIAKAGAIEPLISLISSSDPRLQRYAVTAILNLSLRDDLVALSGAIKPLVGALKTGTSTTRENAACALLYFSKIEANKIAIGRLGGIPRLIDLLVNGGFRGKKDALAALCSLFAVKDNKNRAIQAGIMKPLVKLMADFGSNMVDKSAYAVSLLISLTEAKTSLVEEGGMPVVLKIIEEGSQPEEKIAEAILSQLGREGVVC